jgi:hypothetical protein
MESTIEKLKRLPHGEYHLKELMERTGIEGPPINVALELSRWNGKRGDGWQFRIKRTMRRVLYCFLPNRGIRRTSGSDIQLVRSWEFDHQFLMWQGFFWVRVRISGGS